MAHVKKAKLMSMPAEADSMASGMGMMGPGMGMMDGDMGMMGSGMGMMGSGMGAMGQGMGMGSEMMGCMMDMGPGMAANVAKGGAVMSVTTESGRSVLKSVLKHPAVLIGAGFVAGYLIHKHRKSIIRSANKVAGKGKDFVLHQKENLEDIVAEAEEGEEEATKRKGTSTRRKKD